MISIPDTVTELSHALFVRCTALTSITIPSGVSVINGGMFSGCTALTEITLPESITAIEASAFADCASLETVYYGASAEKLALITVGESNEAFTNANKIYKS